MQTLQMTERLYFLTGLNVTSYWTFW